MEDPSTPLRYAQDDAIVLSSGNEVYSRIVGCKRNTTRWRNVYDVDGLRVKRTNEETTYLYTYLDGQLTHMKVDGQHYYFTYAPSGTPIAMTWNGANYYYVTNLQGDVTHILNSTGAVVTTYVYDAWGKIISTTGTLAGTVGRYNPLRYRGYVYDTETGLYYLQSRYYNPEIGRFLNADGIIASIGGEVLGNNMFAYCFNNSVNMGDLSGNWPEFIKKGVKWLAEKAKPFVKKVQAKLAETDFTYSTGIGTGGSITGYGAQAQGGISFDSKGNVAIQGTIGGRFSTTAGWSGIVYNSVSNAPDISALEGPGYQAGGLYGWNIGYVPVVAGGDINIIPKSDSERAYLGGTFTTGFGSSGFEGHVDWTYTGTLPYSNINIFDCAAKIYHKIMEW